MITMTITSSQYGPVVLEKTIDGKACNIQFFGGSFYIGNLPPGIESGAYEEIVFKPSEFKGAYSPREILRCKPVSVTSSDGSPKETATAKSK